MAVEITQATYDQLSGLQQYAQNEANQSANVSNLEGINRDAARPERMRLRPCSQTQPSSADLWLC